MALRMYTILRKIKNNVHSKSGRYPSDRIGHWLKDHPISRHGNIDTVPLRDDRVTHSNEPAREATQSDGGTSFVKSPPIPY